MPAKTITVSLEGRGTVRLGESGHIATGGEGSVYRVQDTVVKVFTDPGKMVRDGMADKITALKHIVHPSIVAPQGLARDASGAAVGYYMPWIEAEPLSRLFVTTFRTRLGFGDKQDQSLVEQMRDTVGCAHAHGATLVDANELNWLVDTRNVAFPISKVIDVDSWAIGRWRASVIMPSIRDWSKTEFDDGSDWFAWAIVTWQLWTGIHPYQGRAPGYKPGEMERRMKDNISVLSPDVRLPASVREFSRIPAGLMDWYRAVFVDRQRSAPPSRFAAAPIAAPAKTLRMATSGTGAIRFTKLATGPAEVIRIWGSGAALDVEGRIIDLAADRVIADGVEPSAEVAKLADGWLIARRLRAPSFAFHDGRSLHPLESSLHMRHVFRAYDRLFAVTDAELVELNIHRFSKPVLATGRRWTILPDATRFFDDVAVTDLMGRAVVILPLADGGLVQMRCRELDGLSPVAAKAGHRFASVVAVDRTGVYQKVELTFDASHTVYSAWVGATDSPDLNMAILPNGVVATTAKDGELTVFVPANGNIRNVQDRTILTSEILSAWDQKVVLARGSDVWQISLK